MTHTLEELIPDYIQGLPAYVAGKPVEEVEQELPHNSSEPFERVRAEMMKLSTLQCVRSAGQKD